MAIAITVMDLMDKDVVSIDEGKSVAEAVALMVRSKVWSLLVTANGLPQGVVTERDVLRRCINKGLAPADVKVRAIMSSPLVTIGPDATVREAMSLMVEKDVRRLYVVAAGKVVGRLTQTRLFQSNFDLMLSLSGLTGAL
jgi:CBS domain-containing protein